MEAGHAANEDDHCYELAAVSNKTVLMEQPSPASKRNIAAMNSSFKRPFPKNGGQVAEMATASKPPGTTADEDEDEFVIPRSNLMNRYLQSTAANMEVVERTCPEEKGAEREKENTTNAKQRPSERHRRTGGRPNHSNLLHTTFDSELDTGEYENLNFFNGKRFVVQDVDNVNEYTQLLTDIRNFGGTIVDKDAREDVEVDFLVTASVPISNFRPRHRARHAVTNWWIEDVIAARAEVPVEYYHCVITVRDETVLRGTTCTISTYSGVERLFLTTVAQAIGATVEEKYEKKKYPILVCQRPEGGKYKGAVAWGFPVVTKEWLLDSYDKACLHKMEDYLVGDSKVSKAHRHYVDLNARGIHRGADPPEPHDSSVIHIHSESPLLSQVPPSPMVGPASKRKSDDEDTFVRNLEKRQKTHDHLVLLPNCSPSVNNRVKALRSESKSSSSPSTPITQHIREMGQEFGYDTPRRKQLYDVLKETSSLTPHTPHTPAVMKMPELKLHPDPEATPGRQWGVLNKFGGFLDKDQQQQQQKKTGDKKKARSPGTPLSDIKRRFWQQTLGEEYVYNNNSTMLNIDSQQIEVLRRKDGAEDTTIGPGDLDASVASTSQRLSTTVAGVDGSPAVLQGLTDFISKRKSEPKRVIANLETCPVDCADTEGKDPQIMVGWAEPDEVVPFNTPPSKARRASGREPPYFITSGLEVDAAYVKMIQDMRGDIQKKKGEYDPKCTHVICLKPARVEKVLCAMAAGKWIVPLRYIEDSCGAKEFLDEELYEWGNPKSNTDLDAMATIEKVLALAAFTWRTKIHDKTSDKYRGGAFHGFKVLLWSKTPGFKRIIESGGGICLDVG